MRDEVQPNCAGLTLHPDTEDEEHVSFLEARRRGIRLASPDLQRMIDTAIDW